MSGSVAWQPAATWLTLRRRASVLRQIRAFFQQRGVVEVETPLLLSAVAPELHQDPMVCADGYLQGSPETAMKRLLAAGCGDIYQIGRAFRCGEVGRLHNPEFTMLEWYRVGWSLEQLVQEVAALLLTILELPASVGCCGSSGQLTVWRYDEAMRRYAGVDPWQDSLPQLAEACQLPGDQQASPPTGLDRQGVLDWLMVQRVEPAMRAQGGMIFLTAFPATAAAMAEIDPGPPATARRFEVYVNGIELANGYQELRDAEQQRLRLQEINRQRRLAGKASLPIDTAFLQALQAGLPPCAGVALGVDRLLMLAMQAERIQDVMAFPVAAG
ncbi:MAG: EF-P lysine aminoacylase GenX [Magnetococcales bacterium]|nr:EF-P lysine aminoacylase GenX [Magnetococcales bacterium]